MQQIDASQRCFFCCSECWWSTTANPFLFEGKQQHFDILTRKIPGKTSTFGTVGSCSINEVYIPALPPWRIPTLPKQCCHYNFGKNPKAPPNSLENSMASHPSSRCTEWRPPQPKKQIQYMYTMYRYVCVRTVQVKTSNSCDQVMIRQWYM